LAGHWLLYFYALKLSSVAIGMLTVFTYPAMTTLLEPALLGGRYNLRHFLLATLMLLGVLCLSLDFEAGSASSNGLSLVSGSVALGAGLGLLSALLYALRNVLMKTQVTSVPGAVLMTHQMWVVVLVTAPALLVFPILPSAAAWPYVLLLAVVTTALGQTLFLMSFRNFSVSTASLLGTVNPIFGIAWGALFFGELPGVWSIVGGALILSAAAVEAVHTTRKTGDYDK